MIRDRVAIVGVGSTGYSRNSNRSARALAAEASIAAIRDAGLDREAIDGVVSSTSGASQWHLIPPGATEMVAMLRLPAVTYFNDGSGVIGGPLIDAVNAIYSGACTHVLLYHYNYRTPYNSARAAEDPFRRTARRHVRPENVTIAAAYAAWASRYLHETAATKNHLGYVAVNSRTNARRNPLAAIHDPLTLDDYLAARMIRDPLSMLDMDLPVDGADAFVLTSTERARHLPHVPVLVHAATQGLVATSSDEEQLPSLRRHGHHVAVEELWKTSERRLEDTDVAYMYDGFTMISLAWYESVGWCGYGEAGPFVDQHWSESEQRILIDGRIPVNTNGGSLSEGGTQGTGFVREAVHQLRGDADERQVAGAQTALLGIGGLFFNSQAVMLTRDG